MHKNTLLITIFLAILAAAVVAVNVSRFGQQTQDIARPAEESVTPSQEPQLVTYTSEICGVAFKYPDMMQKLETPARDAVVLTNASSSEETILFTCASSAVEDPALIADENEPVQIGSVSGMIYRTEDSSEHVLVVYHPQTEQGMYFASRSSLLDTVMQTLSFFSPTGMTSETITPVVNEPATPPVPQPIETETPNPVTE